MDNFKMKFKHSKFSVDNIDASFYFGDDFTKKTTTSEPTRFHEHAWFELHCVKKGKLTVRTDEKEYIIKANEALLIQPRVYHMSQAEDENILCARIGFEITSNGKNTQENLYKKMSGVFDTMPCKKIIKCRELADNIQNLKKYTGDDTSTNTCRVHNTLSTVLFLLFEKLTEGENNVKTDFEQSVEADDSRNHLLDILTTNEIDTLTLDELSKRIYLSKKQINRIVKKRYNITYKQKQIRFRIENAKKLLKETNEPVDKIAEIVGYTNLTSFYKAFERIVGVTPANYRKQTKN